MKKINKLIAEFMDYENVNEMFPFDGELHYHTSWDWLMPVVERIENLGFEFFIVESRCKVAHNSDNSIATILDSEGKSTKLNHTYSVVVEFINEHNKN